MFCQAEPNSTGLRAEVLASGGAAMPSNEVTLIARDLPRMAFGLFLVSRTQGFVEDLGGSAGNLCLGSPIRRVDGPGQVRSGGRGCAFELAIDLTAVPQPLGAVQVVSCEEWSFQA